MDHKKEPFFDHLFALRSCLIKGLTGVFICMVFCYIFVDKIMDILKKPMLDAMPETAKFAVLAPQEYFFTELKAALFFGFILSSPWLFYQIWHFISPGLYKKEQRMLVYFVAAASSCFALGITFAYFLVFPPTFQFFIETLPEGVSGVYSIGMLYGFAISVLMAFGVVFQTPIAVFLLVLFGLVELKTFYQYRPVIFVLSFVVGAILTPPDPITQIMLAIPAYMLFEIGLIFAKIAIKKRELESDEAAIER
jgi:sec-independent protein translocase protein TatC